MHTTQRARHTATATAAPIAAPRLRALPALALFALAPLPRHAAVPEALQETCGEAKKSAPIDAVAERESSAARLGLVLVANV